MSREIPKRGDIWTVNLEPTVGSEIRKTRPALVVSSDTLQLRGVDVQRFIERKGSVHPNVLEEVAAAIAAVVEYQ